MEMLADFFCSKLFAGYVSVGIAICIAVVFFLKVIMPGSVGEVMDESNDVIMWCFVACLAVGVIFLWLPMLVAVVWVSRLPQEESLLV